MSELTAIEMLTLAGWRALEHELGNIDWRYTALWLASAGASERAKSKDFTV